MAKGKNKITVEVQGKNITGTRKQLDQLAASQRKASQGNEELTKTNVSARRGLHGTANMSSNVTKNFSKMQQGMESGGGSSGGLVRAYALLAANVFALSAAFGILSRSAQIDTLTQSIERLEVVSGKGIKSVARDLQEAAGFGLSFAESLRSVSLATSAGFGGPEIERLGAVAKNAAISLGRNLPDALDRIFRGVIKVEPELLDEIGLFVRVNEAASKYASDLGVAVGDLTEFQKRQAFLNEALEQGEQKFSVFEDIEIDSFAKLQTTFSDLAQDVLSFVNGPIKFLVDILAENKLIFTLIFTAIGTTLLKMAIPAMTQFTARTVENALAARKAAVEQQKKSKATIALINAERQAQEALERQMLETQRREIQANTKNVPIQVGGKKASQRIEAALKKEIAAKGRLQLITKRIADIENPRGLKQRELNKEIQEELTMLRQEEKLLQRIQQIDNNPSRVTEAAPGKQQDVKNIQTKIAAMTAERLANVQAVASNEGLKASLRQIRLEYKALRSDIIATTGAQGFFGKSSATLKAAFFALKAGTISLATAFEALWASIMGPLTLILFALPILQSFNRFLGVGSEAAENLTNASKEMNDVMKLLPKRIEHVNNEMAKLGNDNFKAANQGIEAFKNTIVETIDALDEQQKAFDDYTASASGWAQFWGEKLPELFGGGTKRKIRKNTEEIIETIRSQTAMLTPEMKRLFKELDAASRTRSDQDDEKARQAILDRQREEAGGFKNIRSAIDGARDSARAFANTLIISTDVDKPLATFRQLNTVLESTLLSEKERSSVLGEIANDAAILSLVTENQRRILTSAVATDKAKRAIIQDVEDSYFRQQEVLIRQKQEIAEIRTLQKGIAAIAKVSEKAVEEQFGLRQREVLLQRESLEFAINSAEKATGLTKQEIIELSKKKTLLKNEKVNKENIAAVQAVLNTLQELENFELEQRFAKATEVYRLALKQAEVQKELLGYEEALNKEKIKQVELQAKLKQFSETGSTALSPNRQLEVLIKQTRLEASTMERKKAIEENIVNNKFEIMKAELSTIEAIRAEEKKIIEDKKKFLKDERLHQLEINKIQFTQAISMLSLEFSKGKVNQENFMKSYKALGQLLENTNNEIAAANEKTTNVTKDTVNSVSADMLKITNAQEQALDRIGVSFSNQVDSMAIKLRDLITKLAPGSDVGGSAFEDAQKQRTAARAIDATFTQEDVDAGLTTSDNIGKNIMSEADRAAATTNLLESNLLSFANNISEAFGENGALVSALATTSAALLDIAQNYNVAMTEAANMQEGPQKTAATLAAQFTAVSAGIAQVSSVYAAYMKGNIQQVDDLIAAEKARDGQSKESLAKIAQLEKKKEAMKRKQFETSKKLQLAQAVMSTAAGVANALSMVITAPLAPFIAAMGAVQIALISGMKYTGGAKEVPAPQSSALTIGSRSSAVDTAQRATGGELNYLRGGRTDGTNLGGAGGAMGRKGYANGGEGIVVGERGPEVITPSAPIDITPNFALGGGETNVNFTINAVDAAGVEDILINQRGNLIRMIREAANENGEEFLPTIDPMAYGSKT